MTTETTTESTVKKDKTVDVTIKTPAGHAHGFSFKDDVRVSKVIREALQHFVKAGQLDEGDYGVAVIRHGRAIELALGARLEDYGVIDGETLVLYPLKPQVDGQFDLAA